MPIAILQFEIVDQTWIKRFGRKSDLTGIRREALHEAALLWQKEFLEDHFKDGAGNRYKYARRSRIYTRFIKPEEGKGKGKTAPLVLSGRSERAARFLSRITVTSRSAAVHMPMPAYFSRPFIGTIRDPKTGKTRTIKHQPDKAAELTKLLLMEKRQMARSSRERFQQLLLEAKPVIRRRLRGE